MPLFAIAFLLGIVFLQQWSSLPSGAWLPWLLLSVGTMRWFAWRYCRFFAAGILGFTWCLWVAHLQLSAVLPSSLEGKNVSVTGAIVSIPEQQGQLTHFLFALQEMDHRPVHGLVNLSWQNKQTVLHAGDSWHLTVRLKKIHGTMNPGGFDYEAWSFQKGIQAQGYVLTQWQNVRDQGPGLRYAWVAFRHYLYDKMLTVLPVTHITPWIIALALGERNGVQSADWQVLRNTGTNHLMAIAGLHIGFMSAFAFGLVSWCWRRFPRCVLAMPAQQAGAIAAFMVALVYSALAGFSLPTQRACIMLAIFSILSIRRRKIQAWQAWGHALMIVLLLNPLSVLTDSFWLSFGTVALIIYGMSGRLCPSGHWWKHGRTQWVITVGLVPLSIWLFQECSLVSFLANSIAIPYIGIIIVPLTVCGCILLMVSTHLGGPLLILSEHLLQFLWTILAYLAGLPWATWYHAVPSVGALMAACIGTVMLLLPAGFPGRWLGVIWLLPVIFYHPPTPKAGAVWFTLLDVGQGLSAVVQTQNHTLVFDAGAKLSDEWDMGNSVVMPYLHYIGTAKIDMLVISHGDNDHSGGAAAILQQIPVLQLRSSVPQQFSFYPNADFCLQGQRWRWDGVDFTFLYPSVAQLGMKNDSSCVLRIVNGKQAILLTGDIEKIAEHYLVRHEKNNLAADILIAPHHGSKTSASDEFLDAVAPNIVLFPIGYRNRYHFPHPSVVENYQKRGVIQYDSASAGAIQFYLQGEEQDVLRYRQAHRHYWNSI